ncbi:MAG: sulfatase [Spirochaetota bacterium]
MQPRNVFWIMTDEQRADSVLAPAGAFAPMPNLDRLAAESVRFRTAVTPSPMCIPARTSVLSGRLPAQTGVWRNRANPVTSPTPPLLADWFREAGYATVSYGKQHYELAGRAFDREEQLVLSGHVDYEGYLGGRSHTDFGGVQFRGPTKWIMGGAFPAPREETAEWTVADRAIGTLRTRDRGAPLFMRLSFNAPHTPVVPPQEYIDLTPERIPEPPSLLATDPGWPGWLRLLQERYANAGLFDGGELATMRRHYAAWCSFVDAMIGRFLDALREEGLYEESVVVFCSDHGAHLGDHGLVQKQSFFTESVTVPYLVHAPGVEPREAAEPVSILSLLPTAGALAGLACPAEWASIDFSGDLAAGRTPSPGAVVSQGMLNPTMLDFDHRLVMVQEGTLRATFDLDDPHESPLAFDLERDPYELKSIGGDPAHGADLERLRALAEASVSGVPDHTI